MSGGSTNKRRSVSMFGKKKVRSAEGCSVGEEFARYVIGLSVHVYIYVRGCECVGLCGYGV
jgi:hypothetical protein